MFRKCLIGLVVVMTLFLTGCFLEGGALVKSPIDETMYADLVSVSAVEDLVTLANSKNQESVYVQGYLEPHYGGGGIFMYQSESTATPDGGMVLAVGDG